MKYNEYFYGNKVSEYGLKYGYVDYRTLAKCFDAVFNNDIMSLTDGVVGYWEMVSGYIDHSDEIDSILDKIMDLENELADIEPDSARAFDIHDIITELTEEADSLREDQDNPPEVFQWYIVSDNAIEILEEANEIIYYNETLDMYLWGVTHWGTAWDYVLTDIKLREKPE